MVGEVVARKESSVVFSKQSDVVHLTIWRTIQTGAWRLCPVLELNVFSNTSLFALLKSLFTIHIIFLLCAGTN